MLKITLMFISVGAAGASLLGWKMRTPSHEMTNQKISNLSVSVGDSKNLLVDVPLGHVVLIADQSREMTVHVVRSAKYPNDPQSVKWMDDSVLSAENKDGLLIVRDRPFGKDKFSFESNSKDSRSNTKGNDLDLLVQIHVPSDLVAKLKITAGEAEIGGQFKSFNGSVSAGDLQVNGLKCRDRSDLNVGAGSLKATVQNRSHAASSLHVGAGEVKLLVPSGASADVSASVGVGEISGLPGKVTKEEGIHLGDQRHGRTGHGDSKVDIHVGTGSIKVEARDRVEAATVLDEGTGKSDDPIEIDESDVKAFDGSIKDAVRKAVESTKVSMDSMPKDFDFKVFSDQDFKELDRDLAKSLEGLGPEMEKAMKQAKPEIERAMREMRPEMEKAVREAQKEIRKAMKDVKPEIERALKQAMKELEKALKDMKKSDKNLDE